MAVHHISNTRNTTLHADNAGDTWIVDKSGSIVTPSTGIDAGGSAAGRVIVVKGDVYGLNYGIEFGSLDGTGGGEIAIHAGGLVNSDDTAILSRGDGQVITNNGTINGMEGIYSRGANASITNNGLLEVSNSGIAIEYGTAKIINTGTIIAEGAIWAPTYNDGGASKVVVTNSGTVTGSKVAIELVSDGKHEIHNTGTVNGDIFFGDGKDLLENTGSGKLQNGEIDLGDGNDHVINTGRILDKLALGDGNDVANLRGSKATGEIYGEFGNDVYLISKASTQVYENVGEGKDTIKSTVSLSLADDFHGEIENLVALGHGNLSLTGNALANRLMGNVGANHLDGGLGNDLLIGGKGADVFIFATGSGDDEIKDFHHGIDKIDLSDWAGFDSFHDVKTHLSVSGDDVVISDMTDTLTLHNVSKTDLHANDFIFA